MWRQRSNRDGDRRRWLDAVHRLKESDSIAFDAAADDLDSFVLPVNGVGQDVSAEGEHVPCTQKG